MAGRLLVIGTPIGNLGDLTPRAAEAIRSADLIVAEDTRMARRLLGHLGARRPSVSLTDHNLGERLPRILARLAAGGTLALTTDAGMPAVSDPGARLVAAARAAGASVEVIPGPSAVTTAFAASGVESLGFVFGGFLPARPPRARAERFRNLAGAAASLRLPLVLFEAPHRISGLLADLERMAPEARVAVGRELTKVHEEVLVGSPAEVRAALGIPRGELTLVISDLAAPPPAVPVDPAAILAIAREAGLGSRTTSDLLQAVGMPRRAAYRAASDAHGGRDRGSTAGGRQSADHD
jgi:16S rRNA (cytidine1402-2'-O)-methyltransferase